MISSSSLAKTCFILSVAALGVGYGVAAQRWAWFPSSFAQRAWSQAQSLTETGPVSLMGGKGYDRHGVRMVSPGKIQPGLTLISSSWKNSGGWDPGLRLLDKRGRVVHKWRLNRENIFQESKTQRSRPSDTGVHGVQLLPGGDVVLNLEYVGMVRLDACGEVRWTLAEGNHHSIARAADGSFWTPGISPERRSKSKDHPGGFPGLRGRIVWIDWIINVSDEGKVLNKINVLDVIYKNGLDRHIEKMMGGLPENPKLNRNIDNVTHLNDVEPLRPSMADEYPLFERGDLLVSLRNLNLVFVIDPETRKIKWSSSSPFIYQHDPDFIGNSRIGVFDNNPSLVRTGKMIDKSRIVSLQPHTGSAEVLYPTQHSGPFFTKIMGKWQQLENGNLLLTEAQKGRVVEVGPDGRTVWEWTHKSSYNSKVPVVSKAIRVDVTREQVASWPCSSVDSTRTSIQKQQPTP